MVGGRWYRQSWMMGPTSAALTGSGGNASCNRGLGLTGHSPAASASACACSLNQRATAISDSPTDGKLTRTVSPTHSAALPVRPDDELAVVCSGVISVYLQWDLH